MKNCLVILCLFAVLTSCKNSKGKNYSSMTLKDSLAQKERARGIHDRVITVDTHDDINVNNFTDSLNYTMDLKSQVTLPKMKKGGLDVAWFIVYTGQDSLTEKGYAKAYDNAMRKFKAIHDLCTVFAPDQIALATHSTEVRKLITQGKKVAMIGVENAYPIGTDLSNIQKFYNLGARYMSLSHNGHSQFCDSNTGEKDSVWLYHGLSALGREALIEMNRLGIMIDVSHPSKASMMQIVELSKAPIIASHSSARALCNHSRNLDDEQLLRIKENGGVVQTVAFAAYLNTKKHEARSKIEDAIGKKIMDSLGVTWLERSEIQTLSAEEREAYYKHVSVMRTVRSDKIKSMSGLPPAVDVGDFVDHIDYMVNLIGIDHVGISSDFDGGGGIEGWRDASETFNVTYELVRRGYTEDEITKLWGGNLLRVLDEVQEVARQIQRDNL